MSTAREISASTATVNQIAYIDNLRRNLDVTGPSVADLNIQTASAEIDRLKAIKDEREAPLRAAAQAEEAAYQERLAQRQAAAAAAREAAAATKADPEFQAWAADQKGVPFSEISPLTMRTLVKKWNDR